jgi:transcriptional regulator with XRE-family HTH domain
MAPSPDPFYLEVGRRIHGFRGTKGLTQGELGLRLTPPVTRASIANLENGRQRLLLHTFIQIAEILECELGDLVPPGVTSSRGKDLQTEVAGELKRFKIPNQARTRISRQFMMPVKKEKK